MVDFSNASRLPGVAPIAARVSDDLLVLLGELEVRHFDLAENGQDTAQLDLIVRQIKAVRAYAVERAGCADDQRGDSRPTAEK